MELPTRADPAEPLAQPTRARVFELLAERKRPATTEEIAEELGLHPNGARFHLDRLLEARLIERSKVGGARGRPRYEWSIAPGAEPGGEPPVGYLELARWLGRVVGAGPEGLRGVEETGREIGRELAPRDADEHPGDPMQTALAALGFQPRRQAEEGRIIYCLDNCPYRAAVRESPEVVCALHRGIARGLLDVLEPAAELADFVAKDPDSAGCLIAVGRAGTAG